MADECKGAGEKSPAFCMGWRGMEAKKGQPAALYRAADKGGKQTFAVS